MNDISLHGAREGLARIRRIGGVVRVLALLAILTSIAGTLYVWTQPDVAARALGPVAGVQPSALSGRALALGLVVSLIPLGLFLTAMTGLVRLFGSFREGAVFEARNAGRLAVIGWVLVAYGVTSPLTRALLGLVLTMDNPAGQRAISVSLDSAMILAILGGAALLAFAAVLREAIRLAEENQTFV